MTPPSPHKLAENVWLLIVARMSMIATPVVLALLVWLGGQWIDGKLEPIGKLETRVAATEGSFQSLALEFERMKAQADTNRTNIDKIDTKLDRINDTLAEINRSVSALTALQSRRSVLSSSD